MSVKSSETDKNASLLPAQITLNIWSPERKKNTKIQSKPNQTRTWGHTTQKGSVKFNSKEKTLNPVLESPSSTLRIKNTSRIQYIRNKHNNTVIKKLAPGIEPASTLCSTTVGECQVHPARGEKLTHHFQHTSVLKVWVTNRRTRAEPQRIVGRSLLSRLQYPVHIKSSARD